jgi:ABC-type uncharacterized transport system substrate-binding protein
LEELGYVAGRDFEFVSRFANFQVDRLPNVAAEIVALEPAVIVASAVDTALAAKKTTSTIPIVSGTLADAEHLGLVASYARPSGSVTGITPYVAGLPAKQIELAREVVANAAKVGILGNLSETKAPPQRQELEDAAKALGVAVFTSDVRSPEDVARTIGVLVNERVEVVIVLQTTMMLIQRQAIAAFMEVNLS